MEELEYAVIQPPTGRNCEVIIVLKEIKMKNTAAMSYLFPISFTEIKNLGYEELWMAL